MSVTLVAVGRPSGPLAPTIAEYERRAARYWKLRIVEVAEGAASARDDPEAVMRAEGDRILGTLPEGAATILLTRTGKGMSSEGLARYLQRQRQGGRAVSFVIGGAYGVAPAVAEAAVFHLSLSPMTLPHDLARVVLAEQIYRAGTILRGEPYHKGGGGGSGWGAHRAEGRGARGDAGDA